MGKEKTREAEKIIEAVRETDEEARARRRRRRVRQQWLYSFIALLLIGAIGAGAFFGGRILLERFRPVEGPLRADPGAVASSDDSADTSSRVTEKTPEMLLNEKIDEMIAQMPIEDKVAALFVVTSAQLTGNPALTSADHTLEDALNRFPVAGIVFDATNFTDAKQMSSLLGGAQRMSRYPLFLGVTETGGSMSAVADALAIEHAASPRDLAGAAVAESARASGAAIGAYLAEAGFNLNLAPHAGLSAIPDDTLFGDDPDTVAALSAAFVRGLKESGIICAVDAFPLPGEQDAGGLAGTTTTSVTMADLSERAFVPFRSCMDAGAEIIVLSNLSAARAIGASVNIPCSISEAMVTGQLRGALGFEGIIMTAPFDQEVITGGYTSDAIAVAAIVAGADLIYRPQDLTLAHAGILEAIENGVITEERINRSLKRIYRVKLRDTVE